MASDLPNEPHLGDQRSRERARDRRTLTSVTVGAPVGAALSVFGVWLISLVGGVHASIVVYLVTALLGAAVVPVLLPLITLERDDGRDADIVATRTPPDSRADAPIEGAQEADQGLPTPRL